MPDLEIPFERKTSVEGADLKDEDEASSEPRRPSPDPFFVPRGEGYDPPRSLVTWR